MLLIYTAEITWHPYAKGQTFTLHKGSLKMGQDKKIRCEKVEHDKKENPKMDKKDGLGFGDNVLGTTMA